MISSNAVRFSQNQSRFYQDIMDPSNPHWKTDNSKSRTDKQMWLPMNTNNSGANINNNNNNNIINNNINNNNNSNNNNNNNNNNVSYIPSSVNSGSQIPYADPTFPLVSGRSQDKGSPSNNIHPYPLTNQQQYNSNNQQYHFTNLPNQESSSSGFYDSPLELSLPQLSMHQQTGIIGQPSPSDNRAVIIPSKDAVFFRDSRSNSVTSFPSRFTSRLKSDSSVTSRSSDEESGGFKKTKRSRLGCLTCRHRKKRCCETKPRCTECSRLKLNCSWPIPGTEHKNRSKNNRISHDEMYHSVYGHIKILRGVVEYKIDG